jgi:hypothetical protein
MVLRLKLRLGARLSIAYPNPEPRSRLIILSIVLQLIFIIKSVIIENKKLNITVLLSRISNKI